jgi:hypothetical protein
MRIWIAITLAVVLLLSGGCVKKEITQVQQDALQQYFETNILNRDFTVQLATDNGTDYTPQYSGYLFKLLKNTLADGPMTATKSGMVYTGTWSCNSDYSKLTITLPSSPAEFGFLNREWKFTKKAVPLMELAPWGTTEPKVLHMERQ